MSSQYIREWYMEEYPSDELGANIAERSTWCGLMYCLMNRLDVYQFLGVGDSLVRERVFAKLAKEMNIDYEEIYNQWLRCGKGE